MLLLKTIPYKHLRYFLEGCRPSQTISLYIKKTLSNLFIQAYFFYIYKIIKIITAKIIKR